MPDYGSAPTPQQVTAQNIIAGARLRASMDRAAESRRSEYDRVADQSATNGIFDFFAETDDIGELMVAVNFPMLYMEKPVMNCPGYELADTSWPSPGSFPTISGTIASWIMQGQNYAGANVACVITGSPGAKGIIHISFRGKSFTNPVNAAQSVTEAI